jgi:putative two-component system protein, hydrogenase maturation factor HypX/HoxX
VRILLLCSAFNGLSQRAWIGLVADGHDVTVELAIDEDAIRRAVATADPDVIICPFLRERVPADVWRHRRTIIVHPGPKGDRGPSSLDWAITEAASRWGVTALQAVEEMDAGPIWGSRPFSIGADPPRKSTLYNGPVADASIELIREVVAKAADPTFAPEPLDYDRPDVTGRLRPPMRQSDREFSWTDSTEHILRRIRAADGSPGVRTTIRGLPVSVFDAHSGTATSGEPGTVALRRHGAVLVRTGEGAVWVGQARRVAVPGETSVKVPATTALGDRLVDVPESLDPLGPPAEPAGHREITYRRIGAVGVVTFDLYNGAMSTGQCRRLATALRHATAQDTRVVVVQGGAVFANGIHLNAIETAPQPAREAWRNINAIDDVCREIITCTNQIVVASIGGNAGAGGVMLALGADRVVLRDGVVLNPHYKTMGLYGSEYRTYVLPRRVGDVQARMLTERCLPIGAALAADIGLADVILPGRPIEFESTVLDYAAALAASQDYTRQLDHKRTARDTDEHRRPLDAYRVRELAEMSHDIFDDRHGFAQARHAIVTKQRPASTPLHLAQHVGRSTPGHDDANDLAV